MYSTDDNPELNANSLKLINKFPSAIEIRQWTEIHKDAVL